MTTLEAIPRSNAGYAVRDIGEETIFISPRGDMLHTLNAVGAFIWRNIDGKRSVQDILAMLLQAFEVPAATAQQDVLKFFEELEQKQIVEMLLRS